MMNRQERRKNQKLLSSMITSYSNEIQDMVMQALAFHRVGDLENAKTLYEKVLKLQPNHAEVLNNYGLLKFNLGEIKTALEMLKKSALSKKDEPNYFYNLGTTLREIGEFMEAIKWLEEVLKLESRHLHALINLSVCNYDIGRYDLAETYAKKALEVDPTNIMANNNLAMAYREFSRIKDAKAVYKEMLKIASNHTVRSNYLFNLHYDYDEKSENIFMEHKEWARLYAEQLYSQILPFNNIKDPNKQLRVGFVSADFRRHPIGYFIEYIFKNYNKQKFKFYGYCNTKIVDDLSNILKQSVDEWRVVYALDDANLAQLIRADNIDILIDLSGHTAGNRLLTFARKPAPIQASWIGYFNTTGLSSIDYYISDNFHIPKSQEKYFIEKIYRLPDCYLCYSPPSYMPEMLDEPPSVITKEITFGCFNHPAKINDDVIEVWARILNQLPNAKLFLKVKIPNKNIIEDEFKRRFVRFGVNPEKIEICGWSPHKQMLKEYNKIDIALDPFPYPGGLTSCETLWMSIPIITLCGELPVSRQTALFLNIIGAEELIAYDKDSYVEKAVNLAKDSGRLSHYRKNIRKMMENSPLVDAKAFSINLEKALLSMWNEWVTS